MHAVDLFSYLLDTWYIRVVVKSDSSAVVWDWDNLMFVEDHRRRKKYKELTAVCSETAFC